MLAAALTLGGLTTAHAKAPAPTPTAEDLCQAARAKAAGLYAACQQNAQSKWQLKADQPKFLATSSKCRVKYVATWAKLQARLPTTSCAAARFVDNGDGTVSDNLTGLQWEKKTSAVGTHNVNDQYSWSATGTAADGTAFTAFLPLLNTGVCLGGQCDWRLPTKEELQTLLSEPFSCASHPCVDSALGPTQSDLYWSSSTYLGKPDTAWMVDFNDGSVVNFVPDKLVDMYVRAVRGGL